MFGYDIRCKLCEGTLVLDPELTVRDYVYFSNITSDNAEVVLDSIINKHLVYKCISCGQVYKYTYKELEEQIREHLRKDAFIYIFNSELSDLVSFKHKFFIYCGKCRGFDGSGCCPKEVFDSCKLKRFPINGV